MAIKLVRKEVKFPEVTEATLNEKVATDARAYLGYQFGERRNTEVIEKVTRREQLIKVQSILKSCEVTPLDEASVLRYQSALRTSRQRRVHFGSHRWRWRTVDISEYKAEIPQFALARATEVARKLGKRMPALKKNFTISELHRTRMARPDPDPFMVLQVLGHNFYLDVWHEPDFEGRKTV